MKIPRAPLVAIFNNLLRRLGDEADKTLTHKPHDKGKITAEYSSSNVGWEPDFLFLWELVWSGVWWAYRFWLGCYVWSTA